MNVVVDANIIISALRFGGVPRQLLEAINKGDVAGFTSGITMQEIEEVLLRKFQVTPAEWMMIAEVLRDTLVVVPTSKVPKVTELRDTRDLHILASAELCSADYIISGDHDLLILGQYKSIPIMKASDFIEQLGVN